MKNILSAWRKEIDRIDRELLALIAKRFRIAAQIGKYKKVHTTPIQDKKREHDLIAKRLRLGRTKKFNQRFVKSLISLLLRESRKVQAHIVRKKR